MKNVTGQETDTFDEVNKVLNRLIDNQNQIEAKVEQMATANDIYKAETKKKPTKKKGIATVKILSLVSLVLLLAVTAFGEFQQITFDNVTNDNTLVTILRERLGRTGDTFTFPNGLTIDNATNNAFTWTENSEDLIWTFSSDTITLSSSTSVALIDFGTVLPSFDLVTLKNGLTIDNDTDNKLEFNENSDELIMTFGSDIVTFSSGDVLTIGFGSLYQTFDEISAPSGDPTSNKGWLYVKDNGGVSDLYFEGDDGNAIELTASASGVANLDEAYDGGGSGAGKAVTVDQGAIAFTATDAANNTILSLVQQDQAAASTLVITGSQATANAISIDIDAQTTGRDIEGTGASFYVEGDGTVVAVDVDITGAGGLILANDETVTNNTETEIAFTDSASSENIIIDLDAGSNAVGWKSGSGVDEWAFGAVDDLTGISTVVFDATSVSITHTPDLAGEDFTIQQNGTSQNTSIVITTAGTPADALQLTASAGGIDISATSSDAGDDIDITASGTSVNITATENVEDSIVISSSNAGINITAASATAGEDIDITATGSSINIIATENQANAIVIDASDAAGGIDIDCGTGTLDIDVAGAIDIANSTAVDISFDASAGSFNIDAGQAAVDDAIVIATTGAGSGMRITSLADIDITTTGESGEDITVDNAGGSIIVQSSESAVDSILINSTIGGIQIYAAGAADTEDIDIKATGSSVFIESTQATANAIKLDASTDAGGGIDVDFGTGNLIITGNTAGADMTIDCDLFSIDGTGTSNITVTGGGSEDFSILQAGGAVDNSLILTSTGNAADALQIATLTNGGGIDITANGASAKDLDLVCTNGSTNISGGEADAAAVTIAAASGGITITSGINAGSSIELQANAGTSETIKIYANQGIGTASIELASDDGGVTINANAANGAGLLTLNTLICVGAAGTLADNATPDVSTTSFWETGAATTYTDFDVGTGTEAEGTIIIIKSLHAAVFDVTATELEGGTTDITTATGDLTGWIYDGTAKWRLIFRMDMSDSAD